MRVLAVSPHLDDAAFSVGGTLASLADAGHDVVLLTCFTASVPDPTGFALACQLDKGIPANVDYLALRRAEDVAAATALGVSTAHLGFAEAPHRGYEGAAELFAGVRGDDDVWRPLWERLQTLEADVWLAPQALGGHVDHLQVLRAVAALGKPTLWWQDCPYVLRNPDAKPGAGLPGGLVEVHLPQNRARRADACACYATQLAFQFGGEPTMRQQLENWPEVLKASTQTLDRLSRVPTFSVP